MLQEKEVAASPSGRGTTGFVIKEEISKLRSLLVSRKGQGPSSLFKAETSLFCIPLISTLSRLTLEKGDREGKSWHSMCQWHEKEACEVLPPSP